MPQFNNQRKSSTPHIGAPTRSSYFHLRRLLRRYAPPILALWGLLWLFSSLFGFTRSDGASRIPPGTPLVVIVTNFDPALSESHRQAIEENRRAYAAKHGYECFFTNTTDYMLQDKTPKSWSSIPALRHAMVVYPHTTWLWYLSSSALIMNQQPSLTEHLLDPPLLKSLVIVGGPVVPPDSVIKTVAHSSVNDINLILSQDPTGLSGGSILVRTGDWAKFFLDAWFDPLYRSYNFQKAEGHALEHIVQWHGSVLSKLALVPQKVLNSYVKEAVVQEGATVTVDGTYSEGDFVANFHGCNTDPTRSCEREMEPLITRWRTSSVEQEATKPDS